LLNKELLNKQRINVCGFLKLCKLYNRRVTY
jgi:hypothetical protein